MQGTGGKLTVFLLPFTSLCSRPMLLALGGRHRYSYSVYGDTYQPAVVILRASGRRRECGNDGFWINDCVALIPAIIRLRSPRSSGVSRDCTGQRMYVGWRFTLCAFGPFAMAGAGAPPHIAINRTLSPAPARRLRPSAARIENQPRPAVTGAVGTVFSRRSGYIIVATYLPALMAKARPATSRRTFWSLVGLAIGPGCFWLAIVGGKTQASCHA